MGVQSPVRREEDLRLLRGKGRYVDDVREPNQAHGYVLRSPHAHARIVALDVRRAGIAPGVLLVLDGGAHIALHTGPLARCVGNSGKVVAVEALPHLADNLRRKFPPKNFPNVEVVGRAISSSSLIYAGEKYIGVSWITALAF